MTQRRYRDDEVREISGLATTEKISDPPSSSTANGLTLAEIQSIGLEVGLESDVVARAAAALDARAPQHWRKSWGMPIEVGLTVPLPRSLADLEWEQLVAELRTTFRATGKITTHGGLREWTNGNLHASVEPIEAGYRLRLGTLKGDAAGVNALGAAGIVASTVVFGSLLVSGDLVSGNLLAALLKPIILGAAGIGAFAANWFRLPRWARQRDEQMNHIAARLRSIMGMRSDGQ